jgi:cytochrome P450
MYEVDIAHISLGDLLHPSVLADPYPVFRRLRLEDPVHEDPDGRGWMVSRYDDVASVLGDRRFSAERVLTHQEQDATPNPVQKALARQMLFLDPPDHTRLRNLFTKAFTPHRVEALRPQIIDMVTELLNSAEDTGGRIDFIQDFLSLSPSPLLPKCWGSASRSGPVADLVGGIWQAHQWAASFSRRIDRGPAGHPCIY